MQGTTSNNIRVYFVMPGSMRYELRSGQEQEWGASYEQHVETQVGSWCQELLKSLLLLLIDFICLYFCLLVLDSFPFFFSLQESLLLFSLKSFSYSFLYYVINLNYNFFRAAYVQSKIEGIYIFSYIP